MTRRIVVVVFTPCGGYPCPKGRSICEECAEVERTKDSRRITGQAADILNVEED